LGYTEVIEGGATGADAIAGEEALKLHFSVQHFPAQWEKYGRAAGPIRNTRMLEQRPRLVVAFHSDIANSRGTKNMVEQSEKAGLEVVVVEK